MDRSDIRVRRGRAGRHRGVRGGAVEQHGFVSQVGNTMLALLWLPTTIAGFRMARQRRFVEHR